MSEGRTYKKVVRRQRIVNMGLVIFFPVVVGSVIASLITSNTTFYAISGVSVSFFILIIIYGLNNSRQLSHKKKELAQKAKEHDLYLTPTILSTLEFDYIGQETTNTHLHSVIAVEVAAEVVMQLESEMPDFELLLDIFDYERELDLDSIMSGDIAPVSICTQIVAVSDASLEHILDLFHDAEDKFSSDITYGNEEKLEELADELERVAAISDAGFVNGETTDIEDPVTTYVKRADGGEELYNTWEVFCANAPGNIEEIQETREQLITKIVQSRDELDRTRASDYEILMSASLFVSVARCRTKIDEAENHVERDEGFRAQDILSDCIESLDQLEERAESEDLDSVLPEIESTRQDCLDLQRQAQQVVSGTPQRAPSTGSNETVDWTPQQATTTESAELPDHEVLEDLGSGGNADVRKVRLDESGEIAALKVPRWQGTMSADVVEEFRSEAKTWGSIDDHEHIVSVRDSGTTPYPWMLLEYMPDGSLRGRVNNGSSFSTRVEWLLDVCGALSHAHRHGIAHNDIKPENILFGSGVAKVADWGLAKILLEHSTSIEGMTPEYAAPEQLEPDTYGRTDNITDVYQFGVVAYELLTGEAPYSQSTPAGTVNAILNDTPTPPAEHTRELPTEINDIIMKAMSKEKSSRYEHVLYLRDDLQHLLDDLG